MSSIEKTLNSLQPYVIGIRYLEGKPLVDVVFKEGWSVPEIKNIQRVKGDEGMNYYMLFSEVDNIGLDDLLEYVSGVIKINLEREKKHDLLKTKVKELQVIFKNNNLTKLMNLKFSFKDENLVPDLSDMDVDVEEEEINDVIDGPIDGPTEGPVETKESEGPIEYLDGEGKPLPLTEEELELIEEEKKAKAFLQSKHNKPNSNVKKIKNTKIELPPKPKKVPQLAGGCDCNETEACSLCIEDKDL